MHQFIAVLLALIATTGHALDSRQPASLDNARWLVGCWADQDAEPGSGEYWLPAAGGLMLGIGRTIRDGKAAHYEYLQIRAVDAGKVEYVARPAGKRPTSFTAVRVTLDELVFENRRHDFPQRIIYRRKQADLLIARLEGLREGAQRAFEYRLHRVSCDAEPAWFGS